MRPISVSALALLTMACASFPAVPVLDFDAEPQKLEGTAPPSAAAPHGSRYVVLPGDTLDEIARRKGTTVEELRRANALADPDRLQVGQVLVLPAGAKPPPQAVRARPPRRSPQAAARTAPVAPRTPDVAARAPDAVAPPLLLRPYDHDDPAQSTSSSQSSASRKARAAPSPVSAASFVPVDCTIVDTGESLRSARFEQAIEEAGQARSMLRALPPQPGVNERIAQVEMLAGMAEVALGRDREARESFARALDADPKLKLAPGEVSPKIRRVFEDVRTEPERQASR